MRMKDGPYVKSVRPLDDYQLELFFDNGEGRIFDVKPYMSRGVFIRLRDRSVFDAVRVVSGSIEWPGEIDLSYETLYVGGKEMSRSEYVNSEAADSNEIPGSRKVDQFVRDKRSQYDSSGRESISTEQGLDVANQMVQKAAENKVKCALCGGLAMHLFGFTRATLDVDFIAAARLPLHAKRNLEMGGEAYQMQSQQRDVEVDWIVRDDDKQEVYDAALASSVFTEKGLPIITPEWMAILKYLAGRGKDQIDLMWLLREEGLVDRELVRQHIRELYGRHAYWPLMDMENLFLEADVMRARDKNGE